MRFRDAIDSAVLDGYRYVKNLATGDVKHVAPVVSARAWFDLDRAMEVCEEESGRLRSLDVSVPDATLPPRYLTDHNGKRLFLFVLEREQAFATRYVVDDDGESDLIDIVDNHDGAVVAHVVRGGGFDTEEADRKAEAASLATAKRIAALLNAAGPAANLLAYYHTAIDDPGAHEAQPLVEIDRVIKLLIGEE